MVALDKLMGLSGAIAKLIEQSVYSLPANAVAGRLAARSISQ